VVEKMKNHVITKIQLVICLLAMLCLGILQRSHTAFGAVQEQASDRPQAGDEIRGAVQRAIVPIERAMLGYRENRRCFSCHHHTHAIIGLTEMASRGLKVDRELLQVQFIRTVGRTKGVEHRYLNNSNIGGGVDTTGHALMAMRIGGYLSDETTEAMVKWILKRDRGRGFWTGTKNRAPTQTSDITRTWLCLDALEHFGTSELVDLINERKAQSRQWLLKVETKTTEDAVSQIRALSVVGDAATEVKKFATELIKQQRDDGGWAQTSEMESDAYATGSALITLHQYAGLATNEGFYQRGVEFLKSSQLDDGTWHVKTRATPVQKYFESGFPHGRDQFISMTATCWAATAMALTLPEQNLETKKLTAPLIELSEEKQVQFSARFKQDIWPLVSDNGKSSCIGCHNEKHPSSFRLTGNAESDFSTMLGEGLLNPDDPSGILYSIRSDDKTLMMPPSKLPRWNEEQLETLRQFSEDLYQADSSPESR
jgi:N-acyl-D-amino-acid deacylase